VPALPARAYAVFSQTGEIVWWVEGGLLPTDPEVLEAERAEKLRMEARGA
jgi:hypothetical protein